jgi:hypothetical protein
MRQLGQSTRNIEETCLPRMNIYTSLDRFDETQSIGMSWGVGPCPPEIRSLVARFATYQPPHAAPIEDRVLPVCVLFMSLNAIRNDS